MTEYGLLTVTFVYSVVTGPVTTDIAAFLFVHTSGAVRGHVVTTVAPVTDAALRKTLTLATTSLSAGNVLVCDSGATANLAPSRAAFVRTWRMLRKRPNSMTPRISMKNTIKMTAPSTTVTPRSLALL